MKIGFYAVSLNPLTNSHIHIITQFANLFEVEKKELTEEQVNSLCTLYNKQIENLRKSNKIRKQKLQKSLKYIKSYF